MHMNTQTGTMTWATLDIGKYAGKTLPQVLFTDPDWFFWGFEQKIFQWFLAFDAALLNRRARSIRIPDPEGLGLVAEYAVECNGRFAGLQIVPAARAREGFREVRRSSAIDLSVPHELSRYDKTGYSIMLGDMKEVLFGDRSVRMTKKRCESFYADANNFVEGYRASGPEEC